MLHAALSGTTHAAGTDEEVDLLRRTGTYVAHCPQSNAQLASGIGTNHEHWTDGAHWTQVPRHKEISNQLFEKIKKQAGQVTLAKRCD